MIAARPEVRVAARYAVTNYRLDKDYTIEGTDTALCGLDEAFLSLYPAMEMVGGALSGRIRRGRHHPQRRPAPGNCPWR